jgi:prepilin-type N-terminal cleavage/methylation domain-containing protein
MKTLRKKILHSFTLIELLVVMAIIAILTALTLGAAGGIQNKAARSRAAAEIQAMSTALESYKLDNGIYPGTSSMPLATSSYNPTAYTLSSTLLYQSLSSLTNMTGTPGGKVYMSFKKSQLSSTSSCYIVDPFGYAYGYCTNGASSGYNQGFFDLWSTSGKTSSGAANTNVWVNNWSAN